MAIDPIVFSGSCLEALKAIGKTLGQMTLYKVGHPAVTQSVQASLSVLGGLLQETGEVAYTLDGEKLVANGKVVGTQAQLPNAVIQLFSRFKLNSVIFKLGLTEAELLALCELASLRPELAKETNAAKFLSERSVANITLNEAIYAKVAKAGDGAVVQESGPAAVAAQEPIVPLSETIAKQSLDQQITTLVKAAAKDPAEQARILTAVMNRVVSDIEARVREATETLRREKTQIENEQVRTQSVLTNMAEGVVIVDDQGKVLMMNQAAEELYGVKLIDAAGKPLAAQGRDEHMLTISTELETPNDKPIEGKVEVKSKDDTRRTLRKSTAVVQNEKGKPLGMVSVLSDVAKHNELDRVEREFVAHVTHELRAPLSSIRAALELMQGQLIGKLPEEEERMFMTALRNADRLDDLIKNILDFSKIESGQMTVHTAAVPADKIAKEGAESLRPWCVKKKINLNVSIDPDLPPVEADHSRTVQVIVNLLSNAIKFTPAGGTITVRVFNSGKNDKMVVYSVKDTGPGIAKADQAKIFEKFVQIAAGEKHVGGTGLGLAIAKALIHLQKGTLWVESDVGQGANFVFTLPHHVPPRQAAAPPPPPPPKPWWKRLLGM